MTLKITYCRKRWGFYFFKYIFFSLVNISYTFKPSANVMDIKFLIMKISSSRGTLVLAPIFALEGTEKVMLPGTSPEEPFCMGVLN